MKIKAKFHYTNFLETSRDDTGKYLTCPRRLQGDNQVPGLSREVVTRWTTTKVN